MRKQTVGIVLLIAVAVSIAHYTDNYVNYEDYPRARTLPNPTAGTVLAAWFVFTIPGLVGYLLIRRAPSTLALVLLAFYSGSGLIGLGHYLVPGATDMVWWRQLHIGLDICSGLAVLGLVVCTARHRGPSRQRAHEPR